MDEMSVEKRKKRRQSRKEKGEEKREEKRKEEREIVVEEKPPSLFNVHARAF